MRLVAMLVSIAMSVLTAHAARAADVRSWPTGAALDQNRRITIRVADDGWGTVQATEIQVLLYMVAEELLRHFPDPDIGPILVSPSQDGPVVLYKKGPSNEYLVRLAAKERRWAEYVYEFSHELLHILVNYEYHAPPRLASHQWLEEALCETVSLHTLKSLAGRWERLGTDSAWGQYAATLNEYADIVTSEPHRRLPENMSLAAWFRQNAMRLHGNAYLREKNELVANQLLPLFERCPDWQGLAYLNGPEAHADFESHLVHWYRRTPAPHREFVRHVLELFEFRSLD